MAYSRSNNKEAYHAATSAESPFVADLKLLCDRSRSHLRRTAVSLANQGDRNTALRLLNEVLATEIVCALRYKRHYGNERAGGGGEILQHANAEQAHADQIAGRIVELGGRPNFSPEGMLSRSYSEYVEENR